MKNSRRDGHGITKVLNKQCMRAVKWCTPSIDYSSERVKDPYESCTSVSYETLGFPNIPSGIFKKAYDQAAKVYGADHTLFSVNGSTGSNFTVLRALSKQIPNLRILAQRNIHKSIVYACEDYAINLMFLPANIEPNLQIFLPNYISEILAMVAKTKPQVLLITNPTYEGIVLDLKEVVKQVRKQNPRLIIFIEEAWGSHLQFSDKLPLSAMEAGADICVQSTHKHGGALSQSGMIHWKDGRINSKFLLDSYRSLTTSSPSFILLASLDAARQMMEKQGSKKIDHVLDIASKLSEKINAISGFKVISTKEIRKGNLSVYGRDESKIIVDVSGTGLTGYQIAKILENEFEIIVEKYNAYTILFLVPFRATTRDVNKTIEALTKIRARFNSGKMLRKTPFTMPRNIKKILNLSDVGKLLENQIEEVLLEESRGRISAENITPYPPGIPTTIKGEEFTQEMINYYIKLKEYSNLHIIAQDSKLNTVLVVK
jgi:arginine decarboxylase